MSENRVQGLHVIEIPYYRDDAQFMRQTHQKRELDDFKLCGVYHQAGVPFDIVTATYDEEAYIHNEETIFQSYGALCRSVAEKTEEGLRAGKCIVVVGGDCRHTIGILGGMQAAFGPEKKIGFIWLDSHGDFNTPETSLTGMLGGMPLAVCAGLCCEDWRTIGGLAQPIDPRNIILADGRNLDPLEAEAVERSGMQFLNTVQFCDSAAWKAAVDKLAAQVDQICLHIDLDILDASCVPNHSTPEPNGPDVDTTIARIQTVMETGKLVAYTVLSVHHETGRPGQDISTLNGIRLLGGGLEAWKSCPDFCK